MASRQTSYILFVFHGPINMLDDDHYIANSKNAHLRTDGFQIEIYDHIRRRPELTDVDMAKFVYEKVFSLTNRSPTQPDNDALICRYLTLQKFLHFLDTRNIVFPVASEFSDTWECSVPEDFDLAVLEVLDKLNRPATVWRNYVRCQASRWNVSCWTELSDYFDDHLMWDVYAGGREGIGITIRYGELKRHLETSVDAIDTDLSLKCGKVNYESISLLPFSKHYTFRNEKEVRFAFRSVDAMLTPVSVEAIFDRFGVRISPAADQNHFEMIRTLWIRYGGQDRIQHPR